MAKIPEEDAEVDIDDYPSISPQPLSPACSSCRRLEWTEELQELAEFVRQTTLSDHQDQTSPRAASDYLYSEPAQTILIFDWDDTLFPTTALIEGGAVASSSKPEGEEVKPIEEEALLLWQESLCKYMERACELSDRCLIITNSRRPWVEDCIERFVPGLREVFERVSNPPKIIYARERVPSNASLRAQSLNLRPVKMRQTDLCTLTPEEQEEELTFAKYQAMREETEQFYSLYPGQSWKNIVCLGDMLYERDAVHELAFKRQPKGPERLRVKTFTLPTAPGLSEIALRLQFSTEMLVAYIRHDGSFDLDIRESVDPLKCISETLNMPELATLPFPRHAWGLDGAPRDHADIRRSLAQVAAVVESMFGDEPCVFRLP